MLFDVPAALMSVLGVFMMATSLAAKFIGMPKQIITNFRHKTAPHGMKWFLYFGAAAYASQTLWCALRGEWLMAAAQGPGVITTGVFIWQIIRYPDAQADRSLVRLPAMKVSGIDGVGDVVTLPMQNGFALAYPLSAVAAEGFPLAVGLTVSGASNPQEITATCTQPSIDMPYCIIKPDGTAIDMWPACIEPT